MKRRVLVILLAAFILLVLIAGLWFRVGQNTTPDYSKFVVVATIDGNLELASRLNGILAQQGIVAIIDGSVVYGVQVDPDQKEKAIAVLKADSETRGYWIEF